MTMPAGAEEPDGLADIPAAGADAGTPLVFDAKGVARPAASYEQVQEKPAPEKKKEKGKKGKEETQDTGISPETPCMSLLTVCGTTTPPATWMPWAG